MVCVCVCVSGWVGVCVWVGGWVGVCVGGEGMRACVSGMPDVFLVSVAVGNVPAQVPLCVTARIPKAREGFDRLR